MAYIFTLYSNSCSQLVNADDYPYFYKLNDDFIVLDHYGSKDSTRCHTESLSAVINEDDSSIYIWGLNYKLLHTIPTCVKFPLIKSPTLKIQVIQVALGKRHVLILCNSFNDSTSIHSSIAGDEIITSPVTTVYSLGYGEYGELGLGDNIKKVHEFTPIVFHANVNYIACGPYTSALISSTHYVYTWGSGAYYRLGHGDDNNRYIPTLVEDLIDIGYTYPNGTCSGIKSISCGMHHMIAVTNVTKEIYGWGWNKFNQLGIQQSSSKDNSISSDTINQVRSNIVQYNENVNKLNTPRSIRQKLESNHNESSTLSSSKIETDNTRHIEHIHDQGHVDTRICPSPVYIQSLEEYIDDMEEIDMIVCGWRYTAILVRNMSQRILVMGQLGVTSLSIPGCPTTTSTRITCSNASNHSYTQSSANHFNDKYDGIRVLLDMSKHTFLPYSNTIVCHDENKATREDHPVFPRFKTCKLSSLSEGRNINMSELWIDDIYADRWSLVVHMRDKTNNSKSHA